MNVERPIIFSAPMVRAILDGRKTQTRRVRGLESAYDNRRPFLLMGPPLSDHGIPHGGSAAYFLNGHRDIAYICPYGKEGDRLWVRESIYQSSAGRWCYMEDSSYLQGDIPDEWRGKVALKKVIPSIHLPRWASRILLEITCIRVERLQDISEDDATAEGILFNGDYDLWWDYLREQWFCVDPIDSFASLIRKIDGSETWEKNPWVWVVEFKVIDVKGGNA